MEPLEERSSSETVRDGERHTPSWYVHFNGHRLGPVSNAKFKKMADTLMSIVREGKHHGLAFTLPEDGRDVCCIWTPGVPISFKEADSESE